MRGAEGEVNKLQIYARIPHKFPFDSIALANISKAIALSKACLQLLSSGQPDEAHGLSRSLVECATNLRYLTADPVLQNGRTRDFVKYHLPQKAFWAHYALEQFKGTGKEREILEYAARHGIVPDAKGARRHWSGLNGFVWYVMNVEHPLDGPMTPKHKKMSYAADYFETSAFVHCSLSAIDNYYTEDGVPFQISSSSLQHETHQPTLFIVLNYLHMSIAYAVFGMNIERPARLNALFERTLYKMRPVPTRHHP